MNVSVTAVTVGRDSVEPWLFPMQPSFGDSTELAEVSTESRPTGMTDADKKPQEQLKNTLAVSVLAMEQPVGKLPTGTGESPDPPRP